MLAKFFLFVYVFNFFEYYALTYPQQNPAQDKQLKLWLMVSASKRVIEVSWFNGPSQPGDKIIITDNEVDRFYESANSKWTTNNQNVKILAEIEATQSDGWVQTKEKFNFKLSKSITAATKCYGYWANYINKNGIVLGTGCFRAYPKWMNDMRPNIEGFAMNDLMLPATHDSGSYKPNFNPMNPLDNNPVTKYSLTQDDDIRTQLMHGIRHLDIRVGYYKLPLIGKGTFYITHGPTRQIKLIEAIQQVKNFVRETNEIVIFDVHEFTNGFTRETHDNLVKFLIENFGNILIDPHLTWNVRLSEIWAKGQNVFLSYNNGEMVHNNRDYLFNAVSHQWANKDEWADLEKYLRSRHQSFYYLQDIPVADMAALTPLDKWDVILNRYGGLRKMADSINSKVSKLYREELGKTTNVVAVDFYRGTNIVDISIDYNYAKILRQKW